MSSVRCASFALAFGGATLLASFSSPAMAQGAPPPPEGQPPPPPQGYAPPPAGYAPPPQGYPPGYAPPPYYAPAPAPYYAPPPGYYGPGYAPPGYYRPPPGPYYGPGFRTQPYVYRSPGAMVAGIVGVSLGAILLLSAVVVATQETCDGFGNNCTSNGGAEVGLTVGGIVGIAVGIPLIIYGAHRVPVGAATGSTLPTSPLPKWAGAPAARGWKWEF